MSGIFAVHVFPFSDLYNLSVSPFAHQGTTKLMVKYQPVALRESVAAHACMVRRTVFVELFNHNSVVVALLLSPIRRSVGASITPSHVPPAALMMSPLTDISR